MSEREINISEQELIEFYTNQRLSTYKVAKKLGVSQATVCKYLIEFEIPTRNLKEAWKFREGGYHHTKEYKEKLSRERKGENNPYWKTGITKELLIEYYENQELSANKTGEILGASGRTILRRLKKYNIPIKPRHVIGYKEKHKDWKEGINKKDLIEFYVDQDLPANKIAKILGVNTCTILRRLREYDIHVKTISEVTKGEKNYNWQGGIGKEPYPFEFNEELKEKIRERDNRTCQLCGKEEKYLNQKLSIHHVDYDKDNLNEDNLISLCNCCNSKVNANRIFWTGFLMGYIYRRKYSGV